MNAFRRSTHGQSDAVFAFIEKLQAALRTTTERLGEITETVIEYRLDRTQLRQRNRALELENGDMKDRVDYLESILKIRSDFLSGGPPPV